MSGVLHPQFQAGDQAKPRFPRAAALDVCRELCRELKPVTERLIVAGSLRRRKEEVGDVEILFIPKWGKITRPDQLFAETCNITEATIETLRFRGVLDARLNKDGREAMGPKNKLMVHRASGIPVDLFTASPENWWNYLVCRTGGAESNVLIATVAREQGYSWSPYGSGFIRLSDQRLIPMTSEQHVFEFLGLPYLQPWERA